MRKLNLILAIAGNFFSQIVTTHKIALLCPNTKIIHTIPAQILRTCM